LFQKLVLLFHQGIFDGTEYSKTLEMENTNPEYQTILDAGKITDILEPNRGFSEYDTLFSLCVCECVMGFLFGQNSHRKGHDFSYFRKKSLLMLNKKYDLNTILKAFI
jgi:hypothetical protein